MEQKRYPFSFLFEMLSKKWLGTAFGFLILPTDPGQSGGQGKVFLHSEAGRIEWVHENKPKKRGFSEEVNRALKLPYMVRYTNARNPQISLPLLNVSGGKQRKEGDGVFLL